MALQFSRRKQPDGSHHKLLEQDDTEVSGEEQILFVGEEAKKMKANRERMMLRSIKII